MAVPTIPSISDASGFVNAGPAGISAGFKVAFDQCNARPIMVYVTQQKGAPPEDGAAWPTAEAPPAGAPAPPPPPAPPIQPPPAPGAQKGGQIWRVFDTLSPTEKVPVWKDWATEKTYPNGHWKPHYRDVQPTHTPPSDTPQPSITVRTEVFTIQDTEDHSNFRFDKPPADAGVSQLLHAFRGPPPPQADPPDFVASRDLAKVNQDISEVVAALKKDAQLVGGGPVPIENTPFERKLVVIGHADMCAPFWYNFGLSYRRDLALGVAWNQNPDGQSEPIERWLLSSAGPSAGIVACSDFNPASGPNTHERAAENAPGGFATRPASQPFNGNPGNRRIELFVIPDYKASSGKPSEITKILDEIRGELIGQVTAAGVPASAWGEHRFPCPAGHTPSSSGDEQSSLKICHALSSTQPDPHIGAGEGPAYRHCEFYDRFTRRIRGLEITDTQTHEQPQPPAHQPGQDTPGGQVFDHWEWIKDEDIKEQQGEYHPPKGEHYSYYMDNMVKAGVNAHDVFPPGVAVAPNKKPNLLEFNLIKASSIRVVKLDCGFWADERTVDLDRKAGMRRTPRRTFGLIEGPFVFLCSFETPETRGFVRPCSEGFDKDLTPLCDQFDKAVRAVNPNFKVLILAKAVAEDGPNKGRLKFFFPDMHMPRRFDDKDPEYASSPCIRRAESVKSMVLHQLKRDYRLPAAMTPWLTTLDRRMCRDFFEHGATRLKLPHIYTEGGPNFEMRPTSGGGVAEAVRTAAEAVRNAYNVLMQVGFRLFAFTQDDYRRMVRKYPEKFPEKGYGRTKDLLFNWFYGSTTDRNTPPPPESTLERTAKNMVPELVQDVLDTNAGTKLGLGSGTAPTTESYERVEAGPARDLLRLLRIIRDQQRKKGMPIDVFQIGDIFEIWANRRYLFEDFEICNDPIDPGGQIASLAETLHLDGSTPTGSGGVLATVGALAGDLLKLLARSLLGGMNAADQDLWWRRETNDPARDQNQDPDLAMLPYEEAYTLTKFDPTLHLPRFTAPAAGPGNIGGGMTTPPGGGQISADGIEYIKNQLGTPRADGTWGPFPATNDRGRGYLISEVARRIAQVEAFEAPLRTDDAGKKEDQDLLGGNVVGRGKDLQGRWNKAVFDAFQETNATLLYGNHDSFRGVPRRGGVSSAKPYHSEPGLWVEHGHRYDANNVDGQPLGSFLCNVAYDIQEANFAEGLAGELVMHPEQSNYQPGFIQWFLFVEFGGDAFLKRHQRRNDSVPGVSPFRIAVSGHTHTPDLVVANIIFKDRKAEEVNLPLLGPVKVADIFNAGLAAIKTALLYKKLVEWWDKWDERNGWEKWWADINGNTINWSKDFAGMAACIEQALDFVKKQGAAKLEQLKKEAKDSGGSAKNMVDQNLKNLGLPPT